RACHVTGVQTCALPILPAMTPAGDGAVADADTGRGQGPDPGEKSPGRRGGGLLRSTAVFSAMTLLSRIAGFLRDALQSRVFGVRSEARRVGKDWRAVLW